MKHIKFFLIHLADAIDHYILRHAFYTVCDKIGSASGWWPDHQCNCWWCLKFGTDADWRKQE